MPRAGLSAERVVERAAQIVDEHGLEALSLSRLAADLGVAPPSLYKHVSEPLPTPTEASHTSTPGSIR